MDIEKIKETPVSLTELKARIDEIKKRDKELTFRTQKVNDYLHSIDALKNKDAEELKGDLEKLDISRLNEKQIIKLIDLVPTNLDSLRVIFSNENISIKSEELNKILEVVRKHA
jgi:DNA-directed RNA polymerase subunit F